MKPLAIVAALLLSLPSLFASADLKITADSSVTVIRAGFKFPGLFFNVHNDGPDAATGVKLEVSSPIAVGCNSCDDIGPIPSGESRGRFIDIPAPNDDLTFTVTATVSSAVPDPNPADNTASKTFTVSTAPDLRLRLAVLSAPAEDLGLPFRFFVVLANDSITTAHDVDMTIDFGPEIGTATLPAGCASPAPGRIDCHVDSLAPTGTVEVPAFQITLVAPPAFGGGSMTFAGRATEREHDFDPASNDATITVPLYRTVYVTNTANEGGGSLRQAILDAIGICSSNAPCTIAFRIAEPSANRWKTIRITTPLPAIVAPHVRIEGATQTAFFGDTNPDGPEIEITGGGSVDGDGLVVTTCGEEVANLAVNGFRGNGISVVEAPRSSPCEKTFGSVLHHLFVGTEPTGAGARPNGRGIGTSAGPIGINDSVISGNVHSGIFGLAGRLGAARNRIGVKAHSDEPLPNGNAGVYVGPGCFGSEIGHTFNRFFEGPGQNGNVIAFNGQMGVAVAAGVGEVSMRDNRIWGNGGLALDIGLDGPTPGGAVPAPALTLAHYDPAAKQTIIEGDLATMQNATGAEVEFFASDAPALSGAGEAQRSLGTLRATFPAFPAHVRFAVDGDLTGQFVTATVTRIHFTGFATIGPQRIDDLGNLTQTSELSRPIDVR